VTITHYPFFSLSKNPGKKHNGGIFVSGFARSLLLHAASIGTKILYAECNSGFVMELMLSPL
jgi:hypothetical protein